MTNEFGRNMYMEDSKLKKKEYNPALGDVVKIKRDIYSDRVDYCISGMHFFTVAMLQRKRSSADG